MTQIWSSNTSVVSVSAAANNMHMASGNGQLLAQGLANGKAGAKAVYKGVRYIGNVGGKLSEGEHRRVQDVDVKLNKCREMAADVPNIPPMTFRHLSGDSAIEVFGKYNPIYANQPKKLAMILLMGFGGRIPRIFSIAQTGLFFNIPALVGVRKGAMRTSMAGYMLLEYWAAKFPKFKPFFDAYCRDKKQLKFISSTCVDYAMGFEPAYIKETEEKNKLYTLKYEAREYRRMKKLEEKRKHDKTFLLQQAQAQAEYQAKMSQLLLQNANSSGFNPNSMPVATWTNAVSTNTVPSNTTVAPRGGILGKLLGGI